MFALDPLYKVFTRFICSTPNLIESIETTLKRGDVQRVDALLKEILEETSKVSFEQTTHLLNYLFFKVTEIDKNIDIPQKLKNIYLNKFHNAIYLTFIKNAQILPLDKYFNEAFDSLYDKDNKTESLQILLEIILQPPTSIDKSFFLQVIDKAYTEEIPTSLKLKNPLFLYFQKIFHNIDTTDLIKKTFILLNRHHEADNDFSFLWQELIKERQFNVGTVASDFIGGALCIQSNDLIANCLNAFQNTLSIKFEDPKELYREFSSFCISLLIKYDEDESFVKVLLDYLSKKYPEIENPLQDMLKTYLAKQTSWHVPIPELLNFAVNTLKDPSFTDCCLRYIEEHQLHREIIEDLDFSSLVYIAERCERCYDDDYFKHEDICLHIPHTILQARAPKIGEAITSNPHLPFEIITEMVRFIANPASLKQTNFSIEEIVQRYPFAIQSDMNDFVKKAYLTIESKKNKLSWADVEKLVNIYALSRGSLKNLLQSIFLKMACKKNLQNCSEIESTQEISPKELIKRIRDIDPKAFYRIDFCFFCTYEENGSELVKSLNEIVPDIQTFDLMSVKPPESVIKEAQELFKGAIFPTLK